jgi:CBS domain-containing protein
MRWKPAVLPAFATVVASNVLVFAWQHLPVCEGEFLVGMIGIRDVLRRLVEQAEQQEGARDTARALLTRAPRV